MLAVYHWDQTDSYFCSFKTVLLVGEKKETSAAASIGFFSFEQLINAALFPCSFKALDTSVIPVWFLLCPYISITIRLFLGLSEVPVTVEEQ